MGGWKKEGGGNLTNDTPPNKGFWTPPLVGCVFCPSQVSELCFSCTEIHDRADQKLFKSFGGVQKLSGERVLWYVFLPRYVLHPAMSRPDQKEELFKARPVQFGTRLLPSSCLLNRSRGPKSNRTSRLFPGSLQRKRHKNRTNPGV